MTRKFIPIESLEKRANAPGSTRQPARAFRTVRTRIHKNGRETEPRVVPTERDRSSFDMLRPEEVNQGYGVIWREPEREPGRLD